MNFTTSGARGAHAVVPLTGTTLCVYSPVAVNVLVDLQGAFVPGTSKLRYSALTEPQRVADTRNGARPTTVEVAAPPGADAVTVNLTAASPTGTGYLTAYPCGGAAVPDVSNVNFTAGETVAGSAYVPVGADGKICVSAVGGPHVLVDLTGTFSASGTHVHPGRAHARARHAQWLGRVDRPTRRGQEIAAPVVPAGATAVTGTVTAVDASAAGFVSTAADLDGTPSTSNLNVGAGGTIANSVTTGVRSDGALEIFSSTIADVLVDVTGWWS